MRFRKPNISPLVEYSRSPSLCRLFLRAKVRASALALPLKIKGSPPGLILAVSGTDRNIHIWTRSQDKVGGTLDLPRSPIMSVRVQFIRSATLPGHEDWIRCLAFGALPAEDQPLTLASGSQDGTIRLWNIEPYKKESSSAGLAGTENLSDELLDAFEATLGDLTDAEEGGRQISMKRHILTVRSDQER